MTPKPLRAALLCVLCALAGCAVGPDYQRPELALPAQFKEVRGWKAAEPRDDAPLGRWWEIYGDGSLNALVEQVEISNQNVLASAALYRQAMGVLAGARAGYFPVLSGDFQASRGANAGRAPANSVSTALDASWEADLWGRIGRNVEANSAAAQASAGDLRAALLSAQATLVQSYLQLRVNEAQRRLLDETVEAYQRSLQITRNRYNAGVAGRLDVALAETQLKTTQAQAVDLGVQRNQLEHTIALLIGKAPADFALPVTGQPPGLPSMPLVLPSALLERRPDVAAAERRAAAANARIGVAQSAFFPALTLSAAGGYQNSSLSQLLSLPSRFWSLGPQLALTLFDGGARQALKAQAIAAYDFSVAGYRQAVLQALQDVEDNLSALRVLSEEIEVQREAVRAAAEALRLTNNQYVAGTVSYLNVVTAQASSLNASNVLLVLSGRRLLASAALLKALGGDWGVGEPPGRQEPALP